jgi:hypothetical protein
MMVFKSITLSPYLRLYFGVEVRNGRQGSLFGTVNVDVTNMWPRKGV